MNFLAITPAGLAEALRVATATDAVWCGSDAITEEAFAELKAPNLSRFNYSLSGDGAKEAIEGALGTIEEHHPGQRIWVEARPTS